ncbi:MAG: alpha/beta fold hydrolase [Verrucomicrobia bacterium]|nr:alpha/beta fold hydrolase [Verrucomicrobiota bacterium]
MLFAIAWSAWSALPAQAQLRPGALPGKGKGAGRPQIVREFPNVTLTTNWVKNPTTGAEIFTLVLTPKNKSGEKLPALVLCPGGNGHSILFLSGQGMAQQLAEMGFAAVVFDPEGRGQSQGVEDYCGFKHQDGLAAMVRWVARQPGIDSERIGLCSNSYGVTMATGALARHPDLPARFLIDWEGPMDRNDTGGCDPAKPGMGGHLKSVAKCDDENFWREREAVKFVGRLRVPYQRIQSEKDHVQRDNHHAVAMVNAALAGGVPEVWLNEEFVKQPLDLKNPPKWLPDADADRRNADYYARYAKEMFKYSPKPKAKTF